MDNISIEVRKSLFTDNAHIGNFTDQVESYDHTITAKDGYKTALFSLAGDQLELEDWFENGLVRDVITRDEAGKIIFNGFVNKVSATIGGRTLTRGPVMDVINRLTVDYSPLDTSITPPARGNKTPTAVANDTESQAIYGIIADVYSAGDCTDANALTVRDTILAEHSEPEVSETLSLNAGGQSVNVEVLGYSAYLGVYTYANLSGSGTTGLSTKLQAVLAASPNAIFSTNYGLISTNALPVAAFEDGERRALEVIKAEVAKGNTSNTRYTFGIYANRQAVYAPMPTSFSYQFRLAEGKLEQYGGGEIMPWDILPARWLFYPDFMVGRKPVTDLRKDPRALFIESVSFSAPWGLSINGEKVYTTPQLLARLGLGGT